MIQINNLSHLYPNAEKNALSAVNFDIESASTIGLLGPNGAGKTTLMSLLAGLQSVQQGEIYFDGVPFAKLSKKPVSYTHLRAHETTLHLVCRLLLEKNFFNDTATTEIYTLHIVGSVRCV